MIFIKPLKLTHIICRRSIVAITFNIDPIRRWSSTTGFSTNGITMSNNNLILLQSRAKKYTKDTLIERFSKSHNSKKQINNLSLKGGSESGAILEKSLFFKNSFRIVFPIAKIGEIDQNQKKIFFSNFFDFLPWTIRGDQAKISK